MPKKKPVKGKPKVNKDLEGFEIDINEFGEIRSNFNIDRINEFLNKEVEDKKLVDRPDYEAISSKAEEKRPGNDAAEDETDAEEEDHDPSDMENEDQLDIPREE